LGFLLKKKIRRKWRRKRQKSADPSKVVWAGSAGVDAQNPKTYTRAPSEVTRA